MDILMIDGDRSVLSLVGAMTPDLGRCADNSIQWFGALLLFGHPFT